MLTRLRARALIVALAASLSALNGEHAWARQLEATTKPVLPLSLTDALAKAKARSFRLKRSERSVELGELRVMSTKAYNGPRVDTSLSASQSGRTSWYRTPTGSYTTSPYADMQAGLSVFGSMPIDLFGTGRRQVEQAQISSQSAKLEREQSQLDVTVEVQNSYVFALRAQGAAEADAHVVEGLEAFLDQVKQRQPSLSSFVAVELANARQLYQASISNTEASFDGLTQLLGLDPGTPLLLTSALPEALPAVEREGLLEQAMTARPDVKQALGRLRQAELTAKQTRDARKPQVYLYGYGTLGMTRESPIGPERSRSANGSVFLNVTVPLAYWDGGATASTRRQADIQVEQAQSDMDEQKERIAIELRQAVTSLDRAGKRIDSLPNLQGAALALSDAERAVLDAPPGQAAALLAQATNARSTWRLAATASIEARADYFIAYCRLQRALGLRFDGA